MPKAPAAAADTSQFLTLEQIAEIDDRPIIEVPVAEWHGKVAIRGLSPDQLSEARARAWDVRKKETDSSVLDAWCLTMGVVAPVLSFAGAKQWYIERSFGAVNAVLQAILIATGLGGRAVEEAKSEAPREPAASAL